MIRPIEMHVHSFGLRFQLRHGALDVFSLIDTARAEGFSGVNISANGPGLRDLGGTSKAHFGTVRSHLAGMACELDTSDTGPEHLRRMLEVCVAVGADTLRTYTRYDGPLPGIIRRTVTDLAEIAPIAADLGVMVVLENHEDFTGPSIAHILAEVNHPGVRALYDYGNSQMVAEDPLDALAAMAPYTARVHAKDHVVIDFGGLTWIQGVTMGSGRLPVIRQTELLYENGVRRFCFENSWGYAAAVGSGVELPSTPSFSKDHPHGYLDATTLDPRSAMEEERHAFRQGWDWFRDVLITAEYVIAPPTHSVPRRTDPPLPWSHA